MPQRENTPPRPATQAREKTRNGPPAQAEALPASALESGRGRENPEVDPAALKILKERGVIQLEPEARHSSPPAQTP